MSDKEFMEAINLHVFKVTIKDHGEEEVCFQATTRSEAEVKLLAWLSSEPFVIRSGRITQEEATKRAIEGASRASAAFDDLERLEP